MKIKTGIIIFLLITLISVATWEEIFIKKSLGKIYNIAIEIKNDVEEKQEITQNTIEQIDKLEKKWEKTEYIFCYLINHNDMKEIGDAIAYAKAYSNQNKVNETLEKIDIVMYYAQNYERTFSFNIQNII